MNVQSGQNLSIALYFIYKILPVMVSALSIFLGYKLFIAGVSGNASLVVNATSVQGQLMNAAPGLFFGVGGVVTVIISVLKGVNIKIGDAHFHDESKFSMNNLIKK